MDILLLWVDDIAQVQPLPVEELIQNHARHILPSRDFVRPLWNMDHEMILLPPLPKNRKDHFDFRTLENLSVVTFGIDLMKMDPVHVAHVRGILVDDSFYASQITQPLLY